MHSVWKSVVRLCCGLRFRLLLLVMLVCAPLVLLTLHTASEDRRRAIANWPQRAQRVAQAASREEAMVLAQTRQLLLAIAESAPARSLDREGCNSLLQRLLEASPRYENAGILSRNRELVASSRPMAGFVPVEEPAPGATVVRGSSGQGQSSRRSFFARVFGSARSGNGSAGTGNKTKNAPTHVGGYRGIQMPDPKGDWDNGAFGRLFQQVLETRSFAIGEFSTKSASRTVTMASPVADCSGDLLAVAFATLSYTDFFDGHIRPQLPRGASWSDTGPDGTALIAYPDKAVGVAAGGEAGVSRDGASRAVESVSERGVPVVYALARRQSAFAGGPVLSAMAIPKPVLFAEADRALWRNFSWLGMAAVLAVALGWLGSNLLIVRPLRALVSCSSRVAAGDLTVRTGLPHSHDELGRLTLTFDQMAEALEQREIERKRNSHKLQTLSQKLVEIQETERRHIARELHDEIGQSLTLAEMNLQAALRTAGPPALARRLQASVQAVERVLEQVQDLSLNLRPSLLDDLGLGPTLQWYTSRHAGLAGLQTRLLLEPLENRLDSVIETECFRIMQEALTNIVRHAKARTVMIELTQEEGLLHLSVRDDGVGFQVGPVREEAQRGASLGLLSMEERATLAGGRLELESTPGEGTRVDAWFPLKWRPQVLSE